MVQEHLHTVKHFLGEGRGKMLLEFIVPIIAMIAAGVDWVFLEEDYAQEIFWTSVPAMAITRLLFFAGVMENWEHSKRRTAENGGCDCEKVGEKANPPTENTQDS